MLWRLEFCCALLLLYFSPLFLFYCLLFFFFVLCCLIYCLFSFISFNTIITGSSRGLLFAVDTTREVKTTPTSSSSSSFSTSTYNAPLGIARGNAVIPNSLPAYYFEVAINSLVCIGLYCFLYFQLLWGVVLSPPPCVVDLLFFPPENCCGGNNRELLAPESILPSLLLLLALLLLA